MTMNLKKMWPLAAASLLSVTAVLSADTAKAKNGGGMGAINPDTLGVINPNARPRTDDARMFITVEALYWNAHEDGLEYAMENEEPGVNLPPTIPANGYSMFYDADALEPGKHYNFGFRLGLGYNTTQDGWDLYAAWTHYTTHSSQHNEADRTTTSTRLLPTYSAFGRS